MDTIAQIVERIVAPSGLRRGDFGVVRALSRTANSFIS